MVISREYELPKKVLGRCSSAHSDYNEPPEKNMLENKREFRTRKTPFILYGLAI